MRRKRLAVGMGLALCGGAAIAATVVTILAPWNVDAQAIHMFALGTRPWAVTIDAHSGRALVIDRVTDASGMPTGVGMLSTVDLTAGSVVRSVPVGPDPRAVMVDEGAGRIFVADDDDASLRVLDSRSGAMLRSIAVGARPHAVAADERIGHIFVVNTGDSSVSMLDERRGAVLRTTRVATSWDSAGLAVDAERNRVYVGGPHTVSVLDARDGRMLQRIDVGGSVSGLTVDPRSGQLYVTGDTTLRVVDGPSGHVLRTVPFAGATGTTGAVAVDPARGRVFVTQAAPIDDNGVERFCDGYQWASTRPRLPSMRAAAGSSWSTLAARFCGPIPGPGCPRGCGSASPSYPNRVWPHAPSPAALASSSRCSGSRWLGPADNAGRLAPQHDDALRAVGRQDLVRHACLGHEATT